MSIKALFKYDRHIPAGSIIIDTTSNSGEWRELSPFILPAPPAKNLENLWQYSKVYPHQVDLVTGEPTLKWWEWHDAGFANPRANRYPMGKGAVPMYSYWNRAHLNYIEARKMIYIPEYSKNVVSTVAYRKLHELYKSGADIILLDYDAYDHKALGMTLLDVVNNPQKKMGHAFVLMMMLEGVK